MIMQRQLRFAQELRVEQMCNVLDTEAAKSHPDCKRMFALLAGMSGEKTKAKSTPVALVDAESGERTTDAQGMAEVAAGHLGRLGQPTAASDLSGTAKSAAEWVAGVTAELAARSAAGAKTRDGERAAADFSGWVKFRTGHRTGHCTGICTGPHGCCTGPRGAPWEHGVHPCSHGAARAHTGQC
jgi:hypothetical protein